MEPSAAIILILCLLGIFFIVVGLFWAWCVRRQMNTYIVRRNDIEAVVLEAEAKE